MPGDVSWHRPLLLLDEPLRPHASGRAPAILQICCADVWWNPSGCFCLQHLCLHIWTPATLAGGRGCMSGSCTSECVTYMWQPPESRPATPVLIVWMEHICVTKVVLWITGSAQVFPCPRRREQMGLSPKSGSAKLNAVRELRRAKSSTWSIEQRSITMGKRREGRLCWVLYWQLAKSKHVIILSFKSNDNNLLCSTDCLDLPTSAHIHLHRFSHLFKGPQVISSQVQYLQLWQLVKGTYHGAQLVAGLEECQDTCDKNCVSEKAEYQIIVVKMWLSTNCSGVMVHDVFWRGMTCASA